MLTRTLVCGNINLVASVAGLFIELACRFVNLVRIKKAPFFLSDKHPSIQSNLIRHHELSFPH
jgi:hypothetical protein